MTNAKESLFSNNYFVIPNFIDSQKAKELAAQFKTYCEENNVGNDEQAPNSMVCYNYKPFLEILCDKTSEINLGLGEPVLPTYVYSRVYKNDSVLTPHVDRHACEISITVHLDGDSTWPIWIKTPNDEHRSVMLYSGDAMVYLGCQAEHWREKYEGEWYAQMFLHYVRSNGDNASHYFDRMISLNKHCDIEENNLIENKKKNKDTEILLKEKKEIEEKIEELKLKDLIHKLKKLDQELVDDIEKTSREEAEKEVLGAKIKIDKSEVKDTIETPTLIVPQNKLPSLESFILTVDDLVSKDLCDDILNEYVNSDEWVQATVIAGEYPNKRNCKTISISNQNIILKNETIRQKLDSNLFEYVSKAISLYGEKYEHCSISHDTGYELLKYETGGFYIEHTDSFTSQPRAVSCSICLNEDYVGGEFAFFNREMMIRMPKGGVILFPSNFMFPHEVMPVISGTRYSIVTWFI